LSALAATGASPRRAPDATVTNGDKDSV
jgi:hypothetical protein